MNFLIDANLPRRLVTLFTERGHTALHTLDLPNGNATPDLEILKIADEKNCIVATKDSDFTTFFGSRINPINYCLSQRATSGIGNWK